MNTLTFDKKEVLFTTIITTYQRPKLLKRAINSILLQTYQNFQIVICDNGSDDETRKMMSSFTQSDHRIKYYRHDKNIGMMANYAFGFSQINTPFFSLLSDDDFLLPSFYETALKGFKRYPDAAFSACEVISMNEIGEPITATLSLWNREGYFLAGEGLFEMIEDCFKFPIPTGILFQHSLVKSISINLSKETELLWDVDYIMSILTRYPCVITKKVEAIYLSHKEGYSSNLNEEHPWNIDGYDDFMLGRSRIMQKIQKTNSLTFKRARKARQLFSLQTARHSSIHISMLIKKKKFKEAHVLAKSYYRHFSHQPIILRKHYKVLFLKAIHTFVKIIAVLSIRKSPHPQFQFPTNKLKNYHEYGQQLFNDLITSKNPL